MQPRFGVFLGMLALLALPVAAKAQTIVSMNFEGPGPGILSPSDVAGVVSAMNWNNTAPSSGTATSLVDNSGDVVSGLTLAYTSNYNVGGTPSGSSGYDKLFAGGIESPYAAAPAPASVDSNRVTLYLTDIPYATYNVYVYIANGSGDIYQNTTNLTIGTNAQPFTSATQPEGTYLAGANYVEFTGLSGATQYFVASDATNSGSGGFNGRIVGFQIEDTGTTAVPEPSTWASLALGFAGLMLCLRRRANRYSQV